MVLLKNYLFCPIVETMETTTSLLLIFVALISFPVKRILIGRISETNVSLDGRTPAQNERFIEIDCFLLPDKKQQTYIVHMHWLTSDRTVVRKNFRTVFHIGVLQKG